MRILFLRAIAAIVLVFGATTLLAAAGSFRGASDDASAPEAAVRGRNVVPPGLRASETSSEVLLASAGCREGWINMDFRATGGILQGLQRDFTPGVSTFISLQMSDCAGAIDAIRALGDQRDCTFSPDGDGTVRFVCQGSRDVIVDIVGRSLRAAWSRASAP